MTSTTTLKRCHTDLAATAASTNTGSNRSNQMEAAARRSVRTIVRDVQATTVKSGHLRIVHILMLSPRNLHITSQVRDKPTRPSPTSMRARTVIAHKPTVVVMAEEREAEIETKTMADKATTSQLVSMPTLAEPSCTSLSSELATFFACLANL